MKITGAKMFPLSQAQHEVQFPETTAGADVSSNDFHLVSPGAFNQRAKATIDPIEVSARLLQLSPDLTPEIFKKAILKGLGARNETTKASAPTAAGGKQWFETLDELRNQLLVRQWKIRNQRNCPFIISHDMRISIVVMTGNGETGKKGLEDPSTSADKGSVAEDYVTGNRQLQLFNQAIKFAKDENQSTQVWALLYFYDKNSKEVRYELSLPTDFSKKKITGWGERIILGTIPNDPAGFTIRQDEPNAPATVQVEPKTGTFE